jgi:hypothetical protein
MKNGSRKKNKDSRIGSGKQPDTGCGGRGRKGAMPEPVERLLAQEEFCTVLNGFANLDRETERISPWI